MPERTKAMRALRYEGPAAGVVLSRSVPEPEAGEGEAIVRPTRIAIGADDVLVAARRPDLPPITLGREFVGVIEKLGGRAGKEKGAPRAGTRVIASSREPCGECDLCQRGLAAHCRKRAVVGLAGREGCFADRLTLPLRTLHAVPAAIDDDHAVFAESVASAAHAAQQLRIEGKPYITVLGDNDVALLTGQLMNRLNASVRIVGWVESRVELSAKWGVKHRLERDVGRRADQDVVVECSGTSEGLSLALRLVRPRGKVLLKGPGHAALAVESKADLSLLALHEIELIGSGPGTVTDALAVLARGEADVLSLISKRFRLEDALEGLRTAARPEMIKVLLEG